MSECLRERKCIWRGRVNVSQRIRVCVCVGERVSARVQKINKENNKQKHRNKGKIIQTKEK